MLKWLGIGDCSKGSTDSCPVCTKVTLVGGACQIMIVTAWPWTIMVLGNMFGECHASSMLKTFSVYFDCHDIAEILLRVALNTKKSISQCIFWKRIGALAIVLNHYRRLKLSSLSSSLMLWSSLYLFLKRYKAGPLYEKVSMEEELNVIQNDEGAVMAVIVW